MTPYSRLWTCVTVPLGALGVFETLLVANTKSTVCASLIVGILVGCCYRWMRSGEPRPGFWPAAGAACLGAAATAASVGLYRLLGDGPFLLVLVVLAISSPPAARRAFREVHRAFSRTDLDHDHSSADLAAMRTPELCSAWRTSTDLLQQFTESGEVVKARRLLKVRQQYLDEFERRNPQGFRRWLHSDARADGDLGTYLAAEDV